MRTELGSVGSQLTAAAVEAAAEPYQQRPKWAAEREALRASDFKWMKQLGAGQFGTVYKAKERVSGDRRVVALKVMEKSVLEEREMAAQVRAEAAIHMSLEHAHVCKLMGSFEDDTRQYLVLELAAGGTLYNRQQATRARRFEERHAARYISHIAHALAFVHARGVLHRDVKPENVLLGEDDDAKLCDFGWAMAGTEASERCGTLDYMSPEMVQEVPYGVDADSWALGCVAFELLTGRPPFEREDEEALEYDAVRAATMHRIVAHDYVWPEKPHFSRDARHLVDSLLRLEPSHRLTPKEVLAHPWILKHNRATAAAKIASG